MISPQFVRQSAQTLLLGATLTLLGSTHAQAAEQLTLKFGPFEQTVQVKDLEAYAKTGNVPKSLQLFKPLLNDSVRRGLTARLNLEPSLGQKFAEDMLKSPSGQKLLETIKPAVPGMTTELLQTGISLAIRQFNGLDAIGVVKAIPQDKMTVDVSQAISIASKVNWTYWRTQAMSTILQDSLKVDAGTFNAPFDVNAAGEFEVEQSVMMRTDSKRKRTLNFDAYVPQGNATNKPLVMIAPGYEADKGFLAYIAKHLASYGFTVVSLEHPSVTSEGKINLDRLIPASEFVDRPKDVSFVLDELAKLNESSELQGKFNTDRVMIIGHSLGGYTALALAGGELRLDELRQFCESSNVLERVPADWLQCNATKLPNAKTVRVQDKRIQQAIALNPAIGKIFGKAGLSKVDTPTVVLSSSEDSLAPALSQQFQPFTQLSKQKYLLTAIGSTHLSVSDPSNFSGALATSTLVKEKRGAAVEPLRKAVMGVTLAFAQQMTPEAKKYEPFLSPAYVQSLSSSEIALRFNQELPENVTKLFQLTAMSQRRDA
jgi:predicted dienelactone hydrolase